MLVCENAKSKGINVAVDVMRLVCGVVVGDQEDGRRGTWGSGDRETSQWPQGSLIQPFTSHDASGVFRHSGFPFCLREHGTQI